MPDPTDKRPRIVGWEWAFGTKLHYFRWAGSGKRGFSSVSGSDFQVAFNPMREKPDD